MPWCGNGLVSSGCMVYSEVYGFLCYVQVYRATWNEVQTVAVKQLLQHDARNDIRFLREIAILKECRSTHVVQFLVRPSAP